VSLARNRAALERLLERGARVRYFDHHYAGALPSHPRLEAVIDPSAGVCTSVLVDRHLHGRFRAWAVVAAFGDNLAGTALELARPLALDAAALERLRGLGEALNYNAYGESEADLLVHPAALYGMLAEFDDPLEFAAGKVCARLVAARRADLERARALAPAWSGPGGAVYRLPDAPWSRRVIGELANRLAADDPGRAWAVLAPDARGGCVVSVRAPAAAGTSADELCRGFASGGGRRTAAGIDHLPAAQLDEFVLRFSAAFTERGA
jgi:DHH family putative phosphoesterase